MATISTYLFERNDLLREGLKGFLAGSNFSVTAEFKQVVDLDASKAAEPPALIILGIEKSHADSALYFPGFMREVNQLKARFANARLVLLLSQEDIADLQGISSCNADSYILRDISHSAFLHYLNLIMMGEKILPAPVATLFAANQQEMRGGRGSMARSFNLSEREDDIIKCLIRGDSNKMIAQRLTIAEATVKVHLKTILRKLGVHNRTQVALWAVNNGFNEAASAAANEGSNWLMVSNQ